MMSHRKRDHADVLRPCNKYLSNECKFQDDSCWFLHRQETADNKGAPNPINIEDDIETELGFQEAPKNLKPPLKNNQKPLKLWGEVSDIKYQKRVKQEEQKGKVPKT